MVKKRHAAIRVIAFDPARGSAPGVDCVGLRELIARERGKDLSRLRGLSRPTFHHLMLVTAGRGSHMVDFARHRLTAGSVLSVAPGQVQQFGLEDSLDAQLVVFEPDFLARAPRLWTGARRIHSQRAGTVAALFAATAREHKEGIKSDLTLLRSLVETLVVALSDRATLQPSADASLVARFEAALETTFHRAHEVVAYAALLDCSPRTLARACERARGASAKQLIDERVLLEARRLLAHGSESAAVISAQLGFAEPTQFGKFFKRTAGQTPAAFRARFVRLT